jgi:hypothetical protein
MVFNNIFQASMILKHLCKAGNGSIPYIKPEE